MVKCIALGAGNGRVDMIGKRLKKLHGSSGPFEAAFVLPPLIRFEFGQEGGIAGAMSNWSSGVEEWKKAGEALPPLFLLGDEGVAADAGWMAELPWPSADAKSVTLEGGRITVLRRTGRLSAGGFSLGWVSSDNPGPEIMNELMKEVNGGRAVDVLLSPLLPHGVGKEGGPVMGPSWTSGSGRLTREAVAGLIATLGPRYVFAAAVPVQGGGGEHHGVYHEGPPMLVRPPNGPMGNAVCRVIGLGSVGNANAKSTGNKWLYGMDMDVADSGPPTPAVFAPWAVVPVAAAPPPAPAGVQSGPGTSAFGMGGAGPSGGGQFFFDLPSGRGKGKRSRDGGQGRNEDRPGKRGRGGRRHNPASERLAQAQLPPAKLASCWFCLSSPSAEEHLVVSVGEGSYMAMAKGGLVDDHVLVLPIVHEPSSMKTPEDALGEMRAYIRALRKMATQQGKGLVVFERAIPPVKGTHHHMTWQVIPVPLDAGEKLLKEWSGAKERTSKGNITWSAVSPSPFTEDNTGLKSAVGEAGSYMLIEMPGGECWAGVLGAGGRISFNFGRELAAKAIGAMDRLDWKSVKLSEEQESDAAAGFQAVFASHDPTLQEN